MEPVKNIFRLFDKKNNSYIRDFYIDPQGFPRSVSSLEIIEDAIILRFTGLYGKKKIPIFENDLVKFYYRGKDVICEVVFHEGMFCLKWFDNYINQYPMHSDNYEVIGCSFLLPEALKKQKI